MIQYETKRQLLDIIKPSTYLSKKLMNLNLIFSDFEDKMPYNFGTNIGNSDHSG